MTSLHRPLPDTTRDEHVEVENTAVIDKQKQGPSLSVDVNHSSSVDPLLPDINYCSPLTPHPLTSPHEEDEENYYQEDD